MRFPARLPIREPERTPLALGVERRRGGYEHDFTAKPYLPPGFTFSRTGSALAWQGGQYVSKGTNEPRIEDLDYLGFSGRKGLLIEGARTNLALRSAEFDNASWTVSSGSVTANSVQSPLGTNDADTLTATANSFCRFFQSITVSGGTAYTLSVFVKAGTTTKCSLRMRDGAGVGITSTVNFTATSAWQRVSISGTAATGGTGDIQIYANHNANLGSAAIGDSIHVWGAQVEASTFPSSPIPTAGSTVTRNAETCIRTGLVIPAAGETGLVKGIAARGFSGTQTFYRQDDNSDNEYVRVSINSSGNGIVDVVTGGGSVASLNVGAIAAGSVFAIAWRLAANDFAAVQAGGSVATDTSGALPAGLTYERLGHGRSGNECFGQVIKAPASATRRRGPMSNAALQALAAAA